MVSKDQLLLAMIACLTGAASLASAQQEAPAEKEKSAPEIIRKADLGNTLTFDRETYVLKDSQSTGASELRHYLRQNETVADYRKMISLRMQPPGSTTADAMTLAQTSLGQVLKAYPGSYVKEIEMSPDTATILLVLVKNLDVEFNLWHYRKTKSGLPSVHFVMRNRRPYDTQRKFKAEQKKNLDDWVRDIKALGEQVETLLGATKANKLASEEGRRAVP